MYPAGAPEHSVVPTRTGKHGDRGGGGRDNRHDDTGGREETEDEQTQTSTHDHHPFRSYRRRPCSIMTVASGGSCVLDILARFVAGGDWRASRNLSGAELVRHMDLRLHPLHRRETLCGRGLRRGVAPLAVHSGLRRGVIPQVEVAFTRALYPDGKDHLLDGDLLDELRCGVVPTATNCPRCSPCPTTARR
jgi:hypothetical protein